MEKGLFAEIALHGEGLEDPKIRMSLKDDLLCKAELLACSSRNYGALGEAVLLDDDLPVFFTVILT